MPSLLVEPSAEGDLPVSDLHCIHLTSVEELRPRRPLGTISGGGATWRCRPSGRNCWPNGSSSSSRGPTSTRWSLPTEQRWVAALPLVSCRVGWLIPAGGLPSNPWSPCGELLLDAAADADAALDLLLAAAAELPWQLLWLNETVPEAPRWQALLRACDGPAWPPATTSGSASAASRSIDNWDVYQKRLPKNHRRR